MRETLDFNDGWLFEGRDRVSLPHNAVDLPLNYFDETAFQRVFTYEKRFAADAAWAGREAVLCFDGAMANAEVRLNGVAIARHTDGFTPFEARLSDALLPGENILTVTLDGRENPDFPPFGGPIDYLTYAGIYREVWLQLRPSVAIAKVKIETPEVQTNPRAQVRIWIEAAGGQSVAGTLSAELLDQDGARIAAAALPVLGPEVAFTLDAPPDVRLWSPEDPVLYRLTLRLKTAAGMDSRDIRFGFREIAFTADGFHLNGRRIKLRGLNRHQSFPYAGFALGRAAQERDAEILCRELRVNMVRCSHYPQSTHFLNRCDELGLMVFDELPGWQHIGDRNWQDAALANLRAMIERSWNHPSVVIWGVRINESLDDSDFYRRSNALARALDPTRPTGGVRYITDSELLEDVYTMNDFFLGNEELGGNRPRTPLRPQQEVTGLPAAVPYLVTEHNGHMFPAKAWDQEQRQVEHALRHLEVMNAAYGDPQIAGAIGWCAFDYNTHHYFGSGDRICHHGVMDMFREPKFAAYAYASQGDPAGGIVLRPLTFWAWGDRNIGGVLPLVVATNCDEIAFRFGNLPPWRVSPDRLRFPHLPHPPVILDHRNVDAEVLGRGHLDWAGAAVTGLIGGKVVAEVRLMADPLAEALQLEADRSRIGLADAVRCVARAIDQAGNRLPLFSDPVAIAVDGPARRIGPATVALIGGRAGFWVQATGAGEIGVTVTSERLGKRQLQIEAVPARRCPG